MKVRVGANAIIIQDNKILLIRFEDENGTHYNLPGGGLKKGESALAALKRECLEEACIEIEIGHLAGSWEYVPEIHEYKYGKKQRLGLVFICKLESGSLAQMPTNPDKNQTGVEWVSIHKLQEVTIFPQIEKYILETAQNKYQGFFYSEV